MKLLISLARLLELSDPLEVLLLSMDALIKLQLSLTIVLPALVEFLHTSLLLLGHDTGDVLQVVEENFSFLLLLGVLVGLVDLLHVGELLLEVLLGVDERIEQVAVLAILLRLEVEAVKKLKQALCELGDLHVRWAGLNLSLDHCDLSVLVSKLLLLFDDLVVFSFVLSFNLAQDCGVLLLLHLLLSLLHLGKLLLQPVLLLFAALFELGFGLSKACLFFDES